ncbi:MAG: coenzyme F420-0:L-glutamate ligase [Spirochaetia bacterium]|nr:coenzyme F420-0:L-glutamate ligase [Spirochaetia bacterium]
MHSKVIISPLFGIPDIQKDDSIPKIIIEALDKNKLILEDMDILTIAQKIISKAEGQTVDLKTIQAGKEAIELALKLNKDPRKIQVVLNESKKVIRAFKHKNQVEGTLICEHNLGFISANAGVDASNVAGSDNVLLLPKNPDESAKKIANALSFHYNKLIGVIITDTFGRPWRTGQVNVAIGLGNIPGSIHEKGNLDAYGKLLQVTQPAFADEVAAASGLVVQKANQTPVVVFQGLNWVKSNDSINSLIRSDKEDVFK